MRVRGRLPFSRVYAVAGMSVAFVLASLVAAGQDASLADAVEREDKDAIRALLSQQVDINESQGDGRST